MTLLRARLNHGRTRYSSRASRRVGETILEQAHSRGRENDAHGRYLAAVEITAPVR